MAAPLPKRHVARAANAKAGTTLPPMPNPACCRANTVVGPAANGKPGMSTWHMHETNQPLAPLPRVPAITVAARWHGCGTATCRRGHWRQAPAGTGPGGTCHVSPGQGCRHSEGVFFGKYFQRWYLLTFYWCRWSLLSKIRDKEGRTVWT
jgi:hypothetical protein